MRLFVVDPKRFVVVQQDHLARCVEKARTIQGKRCDLFCSTVEGLVVPEESRMCQFLADAGSAPAEVAGASCAMSPGLRGPEIDRSVRWQRIRWRPIDLTSLLFHDPGMVGGRFHSPVEIVID